MGTLIPPRVRRQPGKSRERDHARSSILPVFLIHNLSIDARKPRMGRGSLTWTKRRTTAEKLQSTVSVTITPCAAPIRRFRGDSGWGRRAQAKTQLKRSSALAASVPGASLARRGRPS